MKRFWFQALDSHSVNIIELQHLTHRAVLLMCLATVVGCGKREAPRLIVHPVVGRLLVNGQPAARAEVTLRPHDPLQDPGKRSVVPYAIVQPDGSFRIGTYAGDDGAPVGSYAVTIVWPQISVEGGEEVGGRDRLQGAFSDPSRSAATVDVQEGENTLPLLDLKVRFQP